ncbi:MAG: PAS domain-containing protein [Burkholderiaceae bacterium]|nr:PAS domain-containing protein [Burkholderiaceae bacterium]
MNFDFSRGRNPLKTTLFANLSIKARVTFSTLGIFVISIFALSFFISKMLEEDMRRILGEQQFSTVSLMASEVNKQISDRLGALEKVAHIITPEIIGNKKLAQKFIEERPILQDLFNGGVIIHQVDGMAIADSLPNAGRIGVNYLDIDTIATALRENKSNIGRPVMGKKLNAPVFGMTAPIHNAQGEVIGAIAGITNFGAPNFLDKISNHAYGKTGGYLLIAPKNRMVITATDKRRIMSPLPSPGVNPTVDKFVNGYENYAIFTNPIGEEVLASAKGVPVAGWYVGIQILVEEAFSPIYAMQQRMLWATIFLTILAGGLTWWILRRQLAPMLSTVQVLTAMAHQKQALQSLPVKNSHDEIGALVVGFNQLIDITVKRQIALAESEKKYRKLFDEMMSGFATHEIICDPSGKPIDYRFIAINPAFEKMTRLKAENTIGKTVLELMPTTESIWIERYGEVALTGKPAQFENYAAPLDRYFEVRAFSPEPGKFATIFNDITDRIRIENKINELNIDFISFLENTKDFIYFKDKKSRFRFCSQTLAEITGHASWREMIGKNDLEVFPDDTAQIYHQEEIPIFRDGKALLNKIDPYYNAAGELGWFSTNKWPLLDANGTVVGLFGISRDITEQRRAEETLKAKTEALARSNAELEQFAYVASHDLRQPLRMIHSYVQMLERRLADKLDDNTRQMMHFASDGAKRMDQMLVSLLEYSRVGRNGQPLVSMSSRDGVEEALRFLAPAIREAHATVRISGDWPEIVASRDEFTRLWQNLIGNAIKYRDPDRPPVLDVTVVPERGGWHFCIADNGIGIDPSQFDRLFRVFQRLQTHDKYEGTGVGLAVARKIVERHGGHIWVESDGNGQGCRFCFNLPALRLNTDIPLESRA